MEAPNQADIVPPNGGGDPSPRCTWNERRLAAVERYAGETRGALSSVASGLDDTKTGLNELKTSVESLETRWVSEFGRLSKATEGNQIRLDRLIEGLAIGNVQPAPDNGAEEVRPTMHSLDYSEGSDTEVQDRPELVVRAKVAERKAIAERTRADSLEAKVAALEARLSERDRQSERARENAKAEAAAALKTNELAVARWKVTAGVVLGVLAALAAIGQAAASAFGG